MKVHLKMFAILRDRSGMAEMDLELPSGATVSKAMEEVAQRFASIADLLPRAGAAVNLAYVARTTTLQDGDELALIPPVSGGCS